MYWPDRFDADDYARDMADFVAEDQEALIFTIGLGPLVRTSTPRVLVDLEAEPIKPIEVPNGSGGWQDVNCDTMAEDCWGAGEQLMYYSAEVGRGKYYYSPGGNQLRAIFLDIASNLATRLTQ